MTGARKTVTRGVNIENADYHGKVGWVGAGTPTGAGIEVDIYI